MALPPLANLSLWQRTVQAHPLLTAAPPPLPADTDVVVVGGGLSGAVLAHALLSADPAVRVTLLEARALASGASGRNAGHCRPDPSRGFTMFERHHGAEQARHVLESESRVLDLVDSFVRSHNIECEWTRRTTFDVSLSPEFTAYSEAAERGLLAVGGSPGTARYDALAAERETRITGAQAAWAWDAATLNPAQLVLGIHGLNMQIGGGRYTVCQHTPVLSVNEDSGRWRVVTPKGEMTAAKVAWANNAYVAQACPELEGIVVPVRAQAHKLSPAPYTTFAPLTASYSLRRSLSLFYSVAPRPDGSVVLGVSRGHLPVSETGNRTDDDSFHPGLAAAALSAFAGLVPGGWTVPGVEELEGWSVRVASGKVEGGKNGEESAEDEETRRMRSVDAPWPASAPASASTPATAPSATTTASNSASATSTSSAPTSSAPATPTGFEYAWSGIIGCTPDLVPLIGDRAGKPGQYLAVGYNGHGMARIFLTAPVLARYMLTGDWDPAMPACFRVTPDRMARLRDGVDSGALRAA